jgi:hypothetical protein
MTPEFLAIVCVGILVTIVLVMTIVQSIKSSPPVTCTFPFPPPHSASLRHTLLSKNTLASGTSLPICSDGTVAVIDAAGNVSVMPLTLFGLYINRTTGKFDTTQAILYPGRTTECSCLKEITGNISVPPGFSVMSGNVDAACMQFPTNAIVLQLISGTVHGSGSIYAIMRVAETGDLQPCDMANSCGATAVCEGMKQLYVRK